MSVDIIVKMDGKEYNIQGYEHMSEAELICSIKNKITLHEAWLNKQNTRAWRMEIFERTIIVTKGIWNYVSKDLKKGTEKEILRVENCEEIIQAVRMRAKEKNILLYEQVK